jgi:hypothetical protein
LPRIVAPSADVSKLLLQLLDLASFVVHFHTALTELQLRGGFGF